MSALVLSPFDTVVVPFPFTERAAIKRRPALVISNHEFNQAQGNSVLAMITSAEQTNWLGDYEIEDLQSAGLPNSCVVRLKLFTLDHRLVIRKAGLLNVSDQKNLKRRWKDLLAI